jgi:L-asparaginase/Glu-tRNA(Gln) amidotransferase subunit D
MKVLIITTGGTIAEAHDKEQGGAMPQVNGTIEFKLLFFVK